MNYCETVYYSKTKSDVREAATAKSGRGDVRH